MTYEDACALLDDALAKRQSIVEVIEGSARKGAPFERLRTAMRSHTFQTGAGTLSLRALVESFDGRSRAEGLHVLQAWDVKAQRFSEEPATALLVDYCARLPKRAADDRMATAVLLDVYFYTILSLVAVRAWDEGDANANLDRLSELVRATNGSGGSGLAYVDDAETLLFLAVSYFHPEEQSYDRLLARVRALDARHQVRVAAPSAAMLGAHLRWGLRFMYQRDVARMRDDNAADYPWLRFAVETLHAAGDAEALLNGLSCDPWLFSDIAIAPPLRDQLLSLQPSHGAFSPLAVAFNFPSNAAVALVAVTLEDGRPYPSLNALFRRDQPGSTTTAEFAERLMQYSASDPGRLGAGGAPLIVHDPADGVRAWNAVMREPGKRN